MTSPLPRVPARRTAPARPIIDPHPAPGRCGDGSGAWYPAVNERGNLRPVCPSEPELYAYVKGWHIGKRMALGNPGKIVGYDPNTGEWLYAAAGLGRVYQITLPVVGKQNIDVPIDQIVRDAMDEAQIELWERIKRNWYYVLGAGLLVGAVVMVTRKKKS